MIDKKEYRSMTVSTKITPTEKIELSRLAEKHKITPSELYYSLIICFKDYYEYIGRTTPKEEKMQDKIDQQEKTIRKLKLDLENAEYHIGMKERLLSKSNKKIDEYRYELVHLKKENKSLKSRNNQLPLELIKFNKLRCKIEMGNRVKQKIQNRF